MKSGEEELSPSPGVTFAYIGEAPMAERVIILRDYDFCVILYYLRIYTFIVSIS